MVWIYGGAYKFGHSGSPGYDARRIAVDGDLVVVTFNYRVAMEGFAHIEGAPRQPGPARPGGRAGVGAGQHRGVRRRPGPGHRLRRVGGRRFRGLPSWPCPRAAGLFHRAIAQSVPGTFYSDELARDIGAALAAELGLRPTVADLAAVDPGQLVKAGQSLAPKMPGCVDRWGRAAPTVTPYSPVVDGDVLPVMPWQALASGASRNVDLIVGHNRDENRLFTAMAGKLGQISEERASAALRLYAPGGETSYRAAFPDASANELYERVQTDWLFAMPRCTWPGRTSRAVAGRSSTS